MTHRTSFWRYLTCSLAYAGFLLGTELFTGTSVQADGFSTPQNRATVASSDNMTLHIDPQPSACPGLKKFSYNAQTGVLLWRVDPEQSKRTSAVLVDPTGQPVSTRLTGIVADPMPGSWVLSYGAKSCPVQATAIVDVAYIQECPLFKVLAYDPHTKTLRWEIDPQGNTSAFADVLDPTGAAVSHELQGQMSNPLPGTWTIEFGARSGCEVIGVTTTTVPSDGDSGLLQ
jgi:hypothetical protein